MKVEVRVPDLGEVDEVEIVEVLVSVGTEVAAEDPLVTLESDKASMDIPSPRAGTIVEVAVAVGAQVKEGTLIVVLESAEEAGGEKANSGQGDSEQEGDTEGKAAAGAGRAETEGGGVDSGGSDSSSKSDGADDAAAKDSKSAAGSGSTKEDPPATSTLPTARTSTDPSTAVDVAPAPGVDLSGDYDTQLLILGSGPGGYTAAFRAADLGVEVTLVERYPTLGGVCLNVGCIPSKALLHTAQVITEVEELRGHGVDFGEPKIDLAALRDWKNSVVGQLTGGLEQMASKRKVEVVQGTGRLVDDHTLAVETADGERKITFAAAILAVGSRPVALPGFPDDPRIIDSTGALELADQPESLLVIGGGVIGLEMAAVYDALGSRVSVVEMLDRLLPGCDADLVRPLQRRIAKRYESIWLGTRVTGIVATEKGLEVSFEGGEAPEKQTFSKVLVAVGRRANGSLIDAAAAGVHVEDSGIVPVDDQMRTNVPHIFAIGDLTGNPMLAHRASHQGRVAAEVIAGEKSGLDSTVIPGVAYTHPEVAWVGLGQDEAKARGIAVGVGRFPWAASGRALSMGGGEGFTKLIFDAESGRVLGGGIVGQHAGDLISEICLAIEMGADAADLALTIHPHPTLSETVAFASEVFEGTVTDLYLPKRKRG